MYVVREPDPYKAGKVVSYDIIRWICVTVIGGISAGTIYITVSYCEPWIRPCDTSLEEPRHHVSPKVTVCPVFGMFAGYVGSGYAISLSCSHRQGENWVVALVLGTALRGTNQRSSWQNSNPSQMLTTQAPAGSWSCVMESSEMRDMITRM